MASPGTGHVLQFSCVLCRLCVIDVGKYFSGVRARTHRLIRFVNDTLLVDKIADPFRKAGFGIVTGAIGESDSPVGIAEEREGKIVFLGEC